MASNFGPETLYCAECGRPTPPDELARFGEMLICPDCKNNYTQKLREGVVSQSVIQYGGFWIRFVAILIDSIILMVIGSILQFALVGTFFTTPRQFPGNDPAAMIGSLAGTLGIVYLLNTLVGCSYEAFFLSSSLSATPGKLALGLKVLRPDGSRLTLGRAAGRYFARTLSGLILLIGYIIAAFDSQKRALHDMICDTRVVKSQG